MLSQPKQKKRSGCAQVALGGLVIFALLILIGALAGEDDSSQSDQRTTETVAAESAPVDTAPPPPTEPPTQAPPRLPPYETKSTCSSRSGLVECTGLIRNNTLQTHSYNISVEIRDPARNVRLDLIEAFAFSVAPGDTAQWEGFGTIGSAGSFTYQVVSVLVN